MATWRTCNLFPGVCTKEGRFSRPKHSFTKRVNNKLFAICRNSSGNDSNSNEDDSKLAKNSSSGETQTPKESLNLNQKIADDALLPPSMREPSLKKVVLINENEGPPSFDKNRNSLNNRKQPKQKFDLNELPKLKGTKESNSTSSLRNESFKGINYDPIIFTDTSFKESIKFDKRVSPLNKFTESRFTLEGEGEIAGGTGGGGGEGGGGDDGSPDEDESDFDPDAFSFGESRMIWFDRACCNAREFLLRIKQRMLNVWIARDPSKTTRLVLFSVSGVSLFVLSLVLYPENPLDFNDSGIFSSVFGRNPRWLLNRELGPLQPTLLSTTFACAAAFAKIRLGANLKPLSNFMHGVLGLPMGFMLVFRWNNAHERWWYGRTCLGNILFYCKNLGGTFCTWVAPDDPILAARALALISTLKECVADRLNGTFITDASIVQKMTTPLDSDDLEGLFGASNKVLFCLEALRGCVQEAFRRGYMPPAIASTVHAEVASIMDNYGSCEKVVNQPPPGCIITHLKCTLMVYVCSLPFILVHEVGVFGVVPVTTLLSLALFGIEAAAEQIEQPFGNRPYDLPVRALMRDNSRDLDQTSKRVLGFTGFVNGRRDLDFDKTVTTNFDTDGENSLVHAEIGGNKNKKSNDVQSALHESHKGVDVTTDEKGSILQARMKGSTNERDRIESSFALSSRTNIPYNEVFFTDNLRTSASVNGVSKDARALNLYSDDVGPTGSIDSSNLTRKSTLDWNNPISESLNPHSVESIAAVSPVSPVQIKESSSNSFRDNLQNSGEIRKLPAWKTQAPIEIMDQLYEKSIQDSPKYHTSRMRKMSYSNNEHEQGNISAKSLAPRRIDPVHILTSKDNGFVESPQLCSHLNMSRVIRSSPEGETDIRDIPHRDSYRSKKC